MITKEIHLAAILATFTAAVLIFVFLQLSGCVTPAPNEPITNPSEPVSSPLPKAALTVDQIAASSACAAYHWRDRGVAPIGYIKSVVRAFQRSVCEKRPVIAQALGSTDKDALAWYGKEANAVNTYTLLLGLGIRESSGNYTEGYDTSAGPETASEAEAGAFQFSYNSINANGALRPLYDSYQRQPGRCLLEVFKEGTRQTTGPSRGVGEARSFQDFTKACPAFQMEYGAALIRVLRRHFGPLNRKEAEFRPECAAMLAEVQALGC